MKHAIIFFSAALLSGCNPTQTGNDNWHYDDTPDHIHGGTRVVASNTPNDEDYFANLTIVKEADGAKWGSISTSTSRIPNSGAGCIGMETLILKIDDNLPVELPCELDRGLGFYVLDHAIIVDIENANNVAVEHKNGKQFLYNVGGLRLNR